MLGEPFATRGFYLWEVSANCMKIILWGALFLMGLGACTSEEESADYTPKPKGYNRIDLPPYKDYATLEQKLTLAVECVLCIFLNMKRC